MRQASLIERKFMELPLMGILRDFSSEDVEHIMPMCISAGLTTIEITMNTPDAEKMIREAVNVHGDRLTIGAGTVCNTDDLERALNAGAAFIVMPISDPQVIRICVQRDVPVFPAAFTPTEIYMAWSLGATMVKLFPAECLGPKFIGDLSGPLHQIKLLATGGINLNNGMSFLDAGAMGLGIGGQLFDKDLINDRNWDGLARHIGSYVQKYMRRT